MSSVHGLPSGGSPASPSPCRSPWAAALNPPQRTPGSIGHLTAHGEDHCALYHALGRQVKALRAVLNHDSPESFRYCLQEGMLITYLATDLGQGVGCCTLLPWGYMFTSQHQPAVTSVRIYHWSQAIRFDAAITAVHEQGCRSRTNAMPYVLHEVPQHLLAPWQHDQQHRVLVASDNTLEAEYDDFVMDGQ